MKSTVIPFSYSIFPMWNRYFLFHTLQNAFLPYQYSIFCLAGYKVSNFLCPPLLDNGGWIIARQRLAHRQSEPDVWQLRCHGLMSSTATTSGSLRLSERFWTYLLHKLGFVTIASHPIKWVQQFYKEMPKSIWKLLFNIIFPTFKWE